MRNEMNVVVVTFLRTMDDETLMPHMEAAFRDYSTIHGVCFPFELMPL